MCPNFDDNIDSDKDGIPEGCDTLTRGDLNSDRKLNLADAVYCLQVIQRITPAEAIRKEADINGDGVINLAEAIYVLQKISELR